MKQSAASVWIGYDKRWAQAFVVARTSARKLLPTSIPTYGILMSRLQDAGLYRRPMTFENNKLTDVISNAPMATEFAITRFFVPHLMKAARPEGERGWALFEDCDVLHRHSLARIFDLTRSQYAVMCVKHDFTPTSGMKMGGQIQTAYPRKLWSSVMLFNCDHPANERLTLEMLNEERGIKLHQFCWLKDEEIGELDVTWNWLPGVSPVNIDPATVHFTDGIPDIPGYENQAYADEWRRAHDDWVM